MAWRPSLEEPKVEAPKPASRERGFQLGLEAFSDAARAVVVAAQRLAEDRGHAWTEPVHVEALLARRFGWGETGPLEARLERCERGPGPKLSGELLALFDAAEARSAADGGRPVSERDLWPAATDGSDALAPDTEPEATADAARILEGAQALASRRGHGVVEPAHLLLALLDEPEVTRAIALSGTVPDALRTELSGSLGEVARGDEPERSEATRAALARAAGEAAREGRAAIEPRDLLLGVLEGPELDELKRGRRLYATIARSALGVELSPQAEEHLRRALGAAPRWSLSAIRQAPLTASMVLGSIAATLALMMRAPFVEELVLRPPLRAWDLWRSLTTVLPHAGTIHLVFNIIWMWFLGVPLERRRGTPITAAFYAWSAYVSAVAQVAWSGAGVGLSGLLYGVAGYHWLVQRREPGSPVVLSRGNARLLGGWLLACVLLTELDVLPIANTAHVMGLVTGLLAGWLATAKDRRVPAAAIAALTAGVTAWALGALAPLGL